DLALGQWRLPLHRGRCGSSQGRLPIHFPGALGRGRLQRPHGLAGRREARRACRGGRRRPLTFAPDLDELLLSGDGVARESMGRIRDFARGRGEDVPEPELQSHWREGEIPDAMDSLDLAAEGIRTVIWSTGYRQDFSWIRVPGVLAENGA